MGLMEYYIIYTAKRMRPDLVKNDKLPADLQEFLLNIQRLADKADGTIQSRQVVALALATWEQLKKCDM
jgi:hypothetical protein|tara:strand:+ start:1747 stop:1953 length:207 start_codon:yes stop_codon:yes gene_type:complete